MTLNLIGYLIGTGMMSLGRMLHLIRDHLKGRCKLRMAGDLHHYMRNSAVQSDKPAFVQHLLAMVVVGHFFILRMSSVTSRNHMELLMKARLLILRLKIRVGQRLGTF